MTSTTWARWREAATPVDVGGVEVATYDLGEPEGPVLTFLHGYPSSSLDAAGILERLGGWRIVTLDFPGFGASAKPPAHPYSIHGCADAVEAAWRAVGVTETIVVAHDYGASVGQELVARALDGVLEATIDGVVWTNGGVYGDLHRPTAGQQMLLDPVDGPALAAAVTEDLFVSGVEGTWGTRRSIERAEIHEMHSSMADGGGVALLSALLHYVGDRRTHGARWAAALESTEIPSRFVWGDLDPVSGAHMADRITERIPGVSMVRLADVGHWPPLEAPDEVAKAVRSLRR